MNAGVNVGLITPDGVEELVTMVRRGETVLEVTWRGATVTVQAHKGFGLLHVGTSYLPSLVKDEAPLPAERVRLRMEVLP